MPGIYGHPWMDSTVHEWLVFFGITMAMEFIGLPNMQLYWSTTDVGPLPALNFGKYMPRWRYMQLNSNQSLGVQKILAAN